MTLLTIGFGRSRRRFAAAVAGCFVALLAIAAAQAQQQREQELTLHQALAVALSTSPELAAQVQALRGLDELVAQARGRMRPTITGTFSQGAVWNRTSEGLVRTSRRYPSTMTFTASQLLFDSFATSNAIRSALENVENGRFTLFQIEQTVLLNATTAYIQVLTAQQNVRLARSNVQVIMRQLQAAQDRFEVGEVTRTDVAQAEAALAQSRSNLATQQGALRQAEEAFRRFVGLDPVRLASLPPIPELPQSLEEAREIALSRSPQLLAAQALVRAAGFSIEEARGALGPQVSLNGSATTQADGTNRGSGTVTGQATLEVVIPLYQGGVARSRVRQNRALQNQRFQELRDLARQVQQNVGNAWEDLMTARATSQSNRAQVQAQQVAFNGVSEEARVGSRTTLDVLEAEQDLLDARTALVSSRANEQTFAYTLLSAVGLLTIETLDLGLQRVNPEIYHEWSQRILIDTEITIDRDAELDTDWMNNWRP